MGLVISQLEGLAYRLVMNYRMDSSCSLSITLFENWLFEFPVELKHSTCSIILRVTWLPASLFTVVHFSMPVSKCHRFQSLLQAGRSQEL